MTSTRNDAPISIFNYMVLIRGYAISSVYSVVTATYLFTTRGNSLARIETLDLY